MMRRFFAFVLAFLMTFSAMPLQALAESMPEETVSSDGLIVTAVEETTAPTETTEVTEETSEPETEPAVILETEPVVETTAAPEVIPETTVAEEVIPETTVAEEVIPETTVTEEVIPETTVAEEVVPETTVAEEVIPETTVAEEVIPETTVAEETVPETTVAEEVIPETTVAEEVVPETTVAEETVPEATAAEETVPEETEEEVEEEAEDVITNEVEEGRAGTNLGWEYATITPKNNGGFTLRDPAGTNAHLGANVTVTINGQNSVEGTSGLKRNVLSRNASGVVNIVAANGYYIEHIVLACYLSGFYDSVTREGPPFSCETAAGDNAYEYVLSSSTPTNVTIPLSTLYQYATHESNVTNYYLMIQLAPLPAPVYVGYDSGSAGGQQIQARPVSETTGIEYYTVNGDRQVAVPVPNGQSETPYPTWSYPTAAATHYALGISPEAEAEANALGYSFAGWALEYYTAYTPNTFSGEMTVGGTNLYMGTEITLTVHAKLTAIWQPMAQLEVEKVWENDNHPDSVTVNILRNGVSSGMTVELNAQNGWKAVVNVPSRDENGNAITYSVSENVPEGYSCSIESVTPSSSEYEYSFRLTNAPIMNDQAGSVIITGRKIWNDGDNAGHTRPGSIVVNLYADGEKIASQSVTGPDWKYSFDVSGVANAADVEFTVGEEAVPNYVLSDAVHPDVQFVNPATSGGWSKISPCSTLSYQNAAGGKTVVAAKMTSSGVVVVWTPDALAQFEQDLIKASLEAGASGLGNPSRYVFLNGEGASSEYGISVDSSELTFRNTSNWSVFWTGTYSRGSSGTTASSLTNSLANASLKVHKVWEDDNDRDGLRPDSVKVQLYKTVNGVKSAVGSPVVLDNSTSWTKQWENLPMYEGGVEIVYSAEEVEVPAGYTVSYSEDTDHMNIVNTHVAAKTEVSVEKVWEDESNRDNVRPAAVTVVLYANGEKAGSLELNAANGWKGSFRDLYVKADGADIVYTVGEEAVPEGYTVSVTGDSNKGFTVTNKHELVTVEVPVSKVWNDNEDQDGKRPGSIQVQLYADGVKSGEPLNLNVNNNWSGSFRNLPKYRAGAVGVEIVYTVKEVAVPEGYTASYEGTTVTNTHVPETANLNVTKVWEDFDDNDGKRPYAVEITLLENGTLTDKTLVLAGSAEALADGLKGSGVWENMPRYRGGQRISYSVEETGYYLTKEAYVGGSVTKGIPDGYTVTHSYNTADSKNPVATVTNTYTPETVGLNVQKTWDDADNQDGIRPASITVELYYKNSEDGEWVASGKTAQLSPANEWDADFVGLPKYHDGYEIIYNVVEEAVEGYTTTYQLDRTNYVVTVTNTHVPEKTAVSVSKNWVDGNDQDGIRPDSITVELYANGEPTGKRAQLKETADGSWTSVTFSDLDKYFHGMEIVYTVVEEAVPGYTAKAPAAANGAIAVTNTHVPETTAVTASKVWSDRNNQDGIRPGSVKVTLYANGVAVDSRTADADSNWQVTFENLPKYENGVEITYTVGEETADVPAGYTASVSGNTITNTHTPEKTSVAVTKVWEDNDNQDGIRPASVTVYLYANGKKVEGKELILNQANGWAGSFTGLDKFAGGEEIRYTVAEAAVAEGYKATVNGGVITNTHTPEKTEVTVTKIWNDDNNREGIRTESVSVALYANGTATGKTAVLNADNSWTAEFTQLDKYANGQIVVYSVQETEVPEGYSVSYGTDAYTGALTVTNTHEISRMDIAVTKTWEDNNDQDGIRPQDLVINLYANGIKADSITLNEANGWQAKWEDLYVYYRGAKITYTVAEEAVAGYQVGYATAEDAEGNRTVAITNTHVPEETAVTFHKIWEDNNNQDGKRPGSIEVILYADGNIKQTMKVTAAQNWSGTFRNLPKFAAGKEIVYTVGEVKIEGYETKIDGYTITNTHEIEKTSLKVEKLWDDEENQDGVRPGSVTVGLYVGSEPVLKSDGTPYTIEVKAEDGWVGEFVDLDKYANGSEIRYIVYEAPVNDTEGNSLGYSPSYVRGDGKITVTNKRDTEKTSLVVQKIWADANDQDGIRPDSITVQLYKTVNGVKTAVGSAVTVDASTTWTYQWSELDVNEGGERIEYSVEEVPVPGYEATRNSDNFGRLLITNRHTPATVEIPVTKVWNDADDQDGIRPERIELVVYANGEEYRTATVQADAEGNWKYTFRNLPKFSAGEEIIYTVGEKAVEGYTAEITAENGGYTVTNTHIPAVVDVPVSKEWVDNADQDGKRPASVTVKLLSDGREVDSLVLNAGNYWAGAFEDMPKFAAGKEIVYTLDEVAVEGYTTKIEGSVITNTHVPETVSITADKVWKDNNDQDGKRPARIVLHLLANGEHMGPGYAAELTAETGWKHTWTGLDKYAGGKEIIYSVQEEVVGNGYHTVVDGFTVTNTYEPEKTSINVWKKWDDKNDQDDLRPDSIVLSLYADGKPTGKTLTVYAKDQWMGTFTGLDKYRSGGELIEYTVKENEIYGYTTKITGDAQQGYLVTNTHEVALTSVKVSKVWDDRDDLDGIRPASVSVSLYCNGEKTDKTAELNAGNGWTWTFEGLDKNYGNGVANVYTVVEEVPAGYSAVTTGSAASGYTITNRHEADTVSISVSKEWDDNHNQDGIRPESITVKLMADGVDTGVTMTLTAEDNWVGSFAGLQKNRKDEEGKTVAIVYTICEEAFAGYNVDAEGNAQELTIPVVDGKFRIVNKHTPETANLNVRKVWNDFGDNDGKRPEAVIITLLENGQSTGKTLTLQAENGWKGVWEDMPRYQNGQRISYSVLETGYIMDGVTYAGVPSGYTVTHDYDVTDVNDPTATVTNSYTPETTGLNVQKVWKDKDNWEAKRPGSVTVVLKRSLDNGATWTVVKDAYGNDVTAVLSPENEWDADFTGLPKYSNKKLIRYSVEEIGYTDDKGNYHEGLAYGEGSVSYQDDISTGVTTVTNTLALSFVDVTVTKVWEDSENQDGKRPESIQVTLYANGIRSESREPAATVTLSQENGWTYTWKDLYEYYKGEKIAYTVVEDTVTEGYSVSYAVVKDETGGDVSAVVTNRYTTDTVSVAVNKAWDDADNQDGIRPASVTVKLLADGAETGETRTLNAQNNWSASFDGLQKNRTKTDPAAKTEAIVYTVVEAAVEGYQAGYKTQVDAEGNYTVTVTNSHATEETTLTAIKVWNDADNQDGKRPDSIILHLLADGVHMGEDYKAELTAKDGWKYTWTGLDKYSDGKLIRYTVYEEAIVLAGEDADMSAQAMDGYTASYKRDSETQITVTNTYVPETTEVFVSKVWNDDSNRDGIRSETVTVALLANGKETGKVLVLSEETDWAGSWLDLPKYELGQLIDYSVKEVEAAKGYEAAVSETAENQFRITNTHAPETTGVTVTKAWDDEDDNDGKRPDGIIVQLYADGSAVEGARVTLDDSNGWTYTWNSSEQMPLYVYAKGELVSYYVLEAGYVADGVEYEGMPEGYEGSATKDGAYTITITNTHATEKTALVVTKQWEDNGDNDGKRPEDIEVTLYKNGTAVETVTLNEENEWIYGWADLYKYAGGELVEYTVSEAAVDGYSAAYKYTANEEGTRIDVVITNTHEAETVSVTVMKEWDDGDDNDGIRPAQIKMTLLCNGEAVETVVLSEKNDWTYTWKDLAKYAEGEELKYTVSEAAVKGYSAEYAYGTSQDGKQITAVVTNTHEAEKISVKVLKQWDDADDNDGARPGKIRVTLLRNGKKVKTVTLNEKNGWTYTWKGLDKFVDGEAAEYTVEEKRVAGYTATYSYTESKDGKKITATIVNSYTTEGKWYAVEKIWKDNKNAEGLRPSSVTVQLYKNGEAYGKKIVLSAANDWKSPKYLPVYEDGEKIEWTIKELEIPKFYKASYNQKTLTVTNTIQSTEVPQTGDQNDLGMWMLMLGICGSGAAAVLLLDKKRRKKA